MTDDFFSGKWAGEYRYGSDYPGLEKKAPITFEIQMRVENGKVTGECVDDETKGYFHRPSVIEGTMQEDRINFKKLYPHFWDHDDNHNPRYIPKLPPRELLYKGQFKDGQFSGEWEIFSVFTDETGEKFEYRGTGSWYMKKVG